MQKFDEIKELAQMKKGISEGEHNIWKYDAGRIEHSVL